MNIRAKNKQQGAVLVIALVMLLVLTFLATSSMRGTSLDARITANRIETIKLQNMAEAALREGEFRLYGALNKNQFETDSSARQANCNKNNILKVNTLGYSYSPQCLLPKPLTDEQELALLKEPVKFIKDAGYGVFNSKDITNAGAAETLAWMPYRGVDESNEYQNTSRDNGYWNIYVIDDGQRHTGGLPGESTVVTMYFLVTGQAGDDAAGGKVAMQSTVKMNVFDN